MEKYVKFLTLFPSYSVPRLVHNKDKNTLLINKHFFNLFSFGN